MKAHVSQVKLPPFLYRKISVVKAYLVVRARVCHATLILLCGYQRKTNAAKASPVASASHAVCVRSSCFHRLKTYAVKANVAVVAQARHLLTNAVSLGYWSKTVDTNLSAECP